jgi:hypothetical protein
MDVLSLPVTMTPNLPNLSHHQCGTLTVDSVTDYDLEGGHSIDSIQMSVPNYWVKDREFREYLVKEINNAIKQL